jgi:DNA repair exonuclease SbcCD ATPase subunit
MTRTPEGPDQTGPDMFPPPRTRTPEQTPRESMRARPALDDAGAACTPSEAAVTPEERTRFEALLEKLENDIRVIGEAHAGNTELLHATRAELERRIEEVDQRVIVLDVKLNKRIDALEQRLDARIDALEQRLDALEQRLDAKIDALEQRLDAKIDALDRKVDRKIDALDRKLTRKLDTKIGALERKMDKKFDVMSVQLGLIAKHLGLGGAPRRGRRAVS